MQPSRRWRLLCGGAGASVAIAAAASLRDPLASMSRYTAALMTLNQIVPPLLLLAAPASGRVRLALSGRLPSGLRRWLYDPWVAVCAFLLVTVAISLPGLFDPAIANALYSAPLGLLELLLGLLLWQHLIGGSPPVGRNWKTGLMGLLAGIPMTAVAVVWMMSPTLLYTPYLDVICIWNIPPLQDQRWAGFVMLVAGLPLQLVSLWLVVRLTPTRAVSST